MERTNIVVSQSDSPNNPSSTACPYCSYFKAELEGTRQQLSQKMQEMTLIHERWKNIEK